MAKKTIILSQKQLDEICGGDSTYLDGLALSPDLPKDFANQITTNGSVEQGYADSMTTDDFAKETTNNNRFFIRGRGAVSTIREMKKKDWEEMILKENDREQHGNRRLNTRRFDNHTYAAAKQNLYRTNKAQKDLKLASSRGDKEGVLRASKTLKRMNRNGSTESGIHYQQARNAQNLLPKQPIKSSPKDGSGKSNSTPQGGVFLN